MRHFPRKTAPGVRRGRVQRKNNWAPTPNCYNTPQKVPAIDWRRPGPGYQHLLRKRDVRAFVGLLPDWDELSRGLRVILLDAGRSDCAGWYNHGLVAVTAWEENLEWVADASWVAEHAALLNRLRVECVLTPDADILVRWTEAQARAYQLLHILLHELGHHHDRMTTRSRRECARGEAFAEEYAYRHEALIWERYLAEFGIPWD